MKFIRSRGFHSLVLPSRNPEKDARSWVAALQLPVVRQSRSEVVLSLGPELFISLVRQPGGAEPPPEVPGAATAYAVSGPQRLVRSAPVRRRGN